MKAKKTVYGSMKDGARLSVVKPTAAQRKKRRLKKRAERKGISTEGMEAVEIGGRRVTKTTRDSERYDKKSQVYNPIKKKRLEERAEKRVRKTGQQMKTVPKAFGSADEKEVVGKVSPDARKGQVRRAERTVRKYKKELGNQGRDQNPPDRLVKGRKKLLRKNR
tara:strand:+ start:947 stop:1438 length:492 start_codon:yes stop_codon:yes gene_type:complete